MIATITSKLLTLYEIQRLRYKTKGLKNTIISFVLFFLFFLIFNLAPFFGKMLWPQNIENKQYFIITRITLFSISMTIVYSLIYLPGYLGVQWYKQYLISPNAPKVWQKPDWNKTKWKTIKMLIINKVIIVPSYYVFTTKVFGVSAHFNEFPTPWELFKTIMLIMVLDDFIYMCLHRMCHEVPAFYEYHKIHHSYNDCASFIGEYCQPMEQIFVNILSATISFSFFKMHAFTNIFWICYKLYMSSEGHCLYEFPFSPFRIMPFVYGASYHDFHHTKNVGNYATSLYLAQFLLGTNKEFFKIQLERLRKLDQDTNKGEIKKID